jgi:hypothetical protein
MEMDKKHRQKCYTIPSEENHVPTQKAQKKSLTLSGLYQQVYDKGTGELVKDLIYGKDIFVYMECEIRLKRIVQMTIFIFFSALAISIVKKIVNNYSVDSANTISIIAFPIILFISFVLTVIVSRRWMK